MGDAEDALPPSKKRVAGRQLTKDDHPDQDDDAPDMEMGTFKKASEEVMATRRVVKVRRNQPAPAASSNPFSGIRLVATPATSMEAKKSMDSSKTDGGSTPQEEEQGESNENSAVGNAAEGTEFAGNSDSIDGTEKNGEKPDKFSEPLSDTGDDKEKNTPVAEEVRPEETSKAEKNGGEKTDSESVKEIIEDQLEENGREAEETEGDAGLKVENAVAESDDKEAATNDLKESAAPAAPLSSFQQLSSSQNAFSALIGTGFSTSSFAFRSSVSGLTGTGFSTSSFASGSLSKEGFSFGTCPGTTFSLSTGSTNGRSSFPSLGTTPDTSKSVKLSMQEVPLETGEENEKAVFTADAIMYEYMDGGWKERGKGELKLNVSVSDAEKARLVMRAKGNFRLILNASIYPDMSLTNMDKKGITFACINSAGEGKGGLITVALKFKDSGIVQEFRELVETHKGKEAASTSEPTKDAD